MLLKIHFKWALDEGKGNQNVKTGKMSMQNNLSDINQYWKLKKKKSIILADDRYGTNVLYFISLSLCVQLDSTVFWHKFTCNFVEASQFRQMPTWTGCVTCPHEQNARWKKIWRKWINMVCADHSVLCVVNYWLLRAENQQNSIDI